MKLVLILIALSILFLPLIESKLNRDDEESVLSFNFDDGMTPLFMNEIEFSEHTTLTNDHNHHHSSLTNNRHHHDKPRFPKHPKHPKHPKRPFGPKRAYVHFPNPPDIVSGVVVFWETRNSTLIYGQFSKGFEEGNEKDYSFKVYKNNKEVFDLKPKGDSLDKIFKINPNGSTDSFFFAVNETLISTQKIIWDDLVISKPDALLGKDKIRFLPCF